MVYQVLHVDPESLIGDEQLGTKPKAWFSRNGEEWLFKEARVGTGEDWAEKIAAEVASRAGVAASTVELATCRGRRGSASQSFVNRQTDILSHGNELLAGQITGYERDKRQRQSDHTLENIVGAINNFSLIKRTSEKASSRPSRAIWFLMLSLVTPIDTTRTGGSFSRTKVKVTRGLSRSSL